jgi:predicted RNA-binding Zn ribbon-like protein
VASVVVDGLVLPIAIGGHPVLDFCNTRAGWGTAAPKEYLRSHDHLALWAAENGLLDRAEVAPLRRLATREAGAAQEVVERAVRFRDGLYDVLVGAGTPASWDGVNTEVRAAGCAVRLRPTAGPATWEVAAPGGPERLDLPLLKVAWSAAGLLTTIGPGAVAACPGRGCGWLFHDPRGRRRWCSMAWCGNRAKARRYAQRAAAS